MLFFFLGPLLCLAVAVSAQEDGARFYGYGSGIPGYPVFYSDGAYSESKESMMANAPAGGAYVGIAPPPNAGFSTNVTLSQNADDGSITASPINSTTTGNWTTPKLAINNNSGAFESVKFSSGDNTTLTTTGFDLWGTLLVWVSDSGDIITKWYAEPVDDQKRTWALKWNTDNSLSNSAVPVVLKNLAPPSTRKSRR
ncbi:hypothetical protein AC578_2454 [Pseudocercospora eumusae]|uniref:Uncharacterized protein n=1 Tax=Pseudocercospora eumusae TaxID=321146 RepID=A0A139HXN2_9PEZI|nr:hypothetical protein AC578_2454 [Pseudocercospora eumusae]